MILQSLRELAMREGLVDSPTLESKPVRWVIEVREDGRFRTLFDTNTPQMLPAGSKKKPREEARLMVIPRRKTGRAGTTVQADFLVDNAKYVLGLDAISGNLVAANAPHCQSFLSLLDKASQTIFSAELKAVRSFLGNALEREKCADELKKQPGFASSELLTFRVDGQLLHDVKQLQEYWASLQQGTPLRSSTQCLVCGSLQPPTRLHNKIEIRGPSSNGAPFVSFNNEAFDKYGWVKSENAPICTPCMTAYVEGLRRLTRQRYFSPRAGQNVRSLSTVLTDNTTAVYWAETDTPLIAGMSALRDDPKTVADLLATPLTGSERLVSNAARLFCLILTGVKGRVVIRRVHTGTVGQVAANLRRYFTAIHVDRFDASAPLPQYRLLQAMVLNGELKRLSAETGTELWLAALFGLPLSRTFLAALVGRNQAEQKVPPERAALLQFYFAVRRTAAASTGNDKEKSEPMSLDMEYENKAYLLGRLLAVLESLQTAAQPQGLNRTLVDRFFGAAATRPGAVFPQLIKDAVHHKSKAMKIAPGRVIELDKSMSAILAGIKPQEGFGHGQDLEDQGRFALGYYHQRQHMIRSAMDAKARREQQARTSADDITDTQAAVNYSGELA